MGEKRVSKLESLERVLAPSRGELRAWLRKHHLKSIGVWLVTNKKGSGLPYLPYEEAVEELLCFGWIDGLTRGLDERRSMILCTPRKAGSGWSRPNKERVARLELTGKMTAAGKTAVERAKRDGSWEKLDQVEALVIPPDLARALRALPPAADHFGAFPRSVKRAILEWITQAKRPQTRARRVEQTATLAQRNERANQWPRP